jgi:hypothetical protein
MIAPMCGSLPTCLIGKDTEILTARDRWELGESINKLGHANVPQVACVPFRRPPCGSSSIFRCPPLPLGFLHLRSNTSSTAPLTLLVTQG